MPNLVIPYTLPDNYTYDPNKIEVVDGHSQLKTAGVWSGLVAYYRMEEMSWNGSSGEVKDSSPNHYDGVAYGGLSTNSAGLIGRCGLFDGSNDRIKVQSTSISSIISGSRPCFSSTSRSKYVLMPLMAPSC